MKPRVQFSVLGAKNPEQVIANSMSMYKQNKTPQPNGNPKYVRLRDYLKIN
jgi:hypothetical protein